MMYTGSSGIWDSVWLECVPAGPRIEAVVATAKLAASAAAFELVVAGVAGVADAAGLSACVTVTEPAAAGSTAGAPAAPSAPAAPAMAKAKVVAVMCADVTVASDGSTSLVTVPMPTTTKRWTPDTPFLYTAHVELKQRTPLQPVATRAATADAKPLDAVDTYFGFRSVGTGVVDGVPRVLLNGVPYYSLGVLDQGWFPDGLYTAATDAALASDLVALKAMVMCNADRVLGSVTRVAHPDGAPRAPPRHARHGARAN